MYINIIAQNGFSFSGIIATRENALNAYMQFYKMPSVEAISTKN